MTNQTERGQTSVIQHIDDCPFYPHNVKANPQPIFVVGKRQHGKTTTAMELAFTRMCFGGYNKLYIYSHNKIAVDMRANNSKYSLSANFDRSEFQIHHSVFDTEKPTLPEELTRDSKAVGVFLDVMISDNAFVPWRPYMNDCCRKEHDCQGQLIFELSFNERVYYQH